MSSCHKGALNGTEHRRCCALDSERSRPHRRATQVKVLIVVRSKGYSPSVRLTVTQERVTGIWRGAVASPGRSLASRCSLTYTTETKTLWKTTTSFMLTIVPGPMGVPQRLPSWWLPRHGLSNLPLLVLKVYGSVREKVRYFKTHFFCV